MKTVLSRMLRIVSGLCLTAGATALLAGCVHSKFPQKRVPLRVQPVGPFQSYDSTMFAEIEKKWNELVRKHTVPGENSGVVTVQFDLQYDGTVRNLKVTENSANELLAAYCIAAIQKSAPFGRWAEDLSAVVSDKQRKIAITFFY